MTRRHRARLTLAVAVLPLAAVVCRAAPAGARARGEIGSAYLEALTTLAAGDATDALAKLVELEKRLVSSTEKEAEQVDKEQLEIARRLARTSGESLVPLAVLHERAYLAHLDAGDLRLAIRSRRHAQALIELYVSTSRGSDAAARLGSELLTSLGGSLQQASMPSIAIQLYERALELAPHNPFALLGLAALYERQGRYASTVVYLETLLDSEPDHREAQLRLGINLLRLGRRTEAEAALERLRAGERQDWILSLAYQELARLAELDGAGERAGALLGEALRRLPDDPSLPVQIAYLADRLGSRQATDLGAALRSGAHSRRPSPRSLYSRASGQAVEQLRVALALASEQRLPDLQAALDGPRRERG